MTIPLGLNHGDWFVFLGVGRTAIRDTERLLAKECAGSE